MQTRFDGRCKRAFLYPRRHHACSRNWRNPSSPSIHARLLSRGMQTIGQCQHGRSLCPHRPCTAPHSSQYESYDPGIEARDLLAVSGYLCNVFEAVLELPEIDAIQRMMRQYGALGSRMTGSGSAVFGIFRAENDAQNCVAFLKSQYSQTFLCHPVSQGVE